MKKHEIIYCDILNKISTGEYKLGGTIPSENSLSKTFETSRVTVRKSLEELEKNGFIHKSQGKESIVISKSTKPKTVLLILPNLFKYIFIDLIREIENTLRERKISLLIACSYNNQKLERNIIRNYLSVVDAIILEPTQAHDTDYTNSKTYNSLTTIPTVCINTTIKEIALPHLVLDDYNNGVELTKYVISQKKQKILILAKTDDLQGYSRFQGIKDTLDNNSCNYKYVEFTTQDEERKIKSFYKLFTHFKPDCLMFYNDEYAYSFMTNNNINPIIDDILITGYDNTEYSNGHPYFFPSPNHPKGQMGRDAANMIISLLNGKPVQSIIYDTDIDFDK